MDHPRSPLDNLHIAAPCHANWDEMTGDERSRFCKLCTKHVYNLSVMTRAEAEALIVEKEGKLCVQYAKRADGTIISDNCPVGLRTVRDSLRWIGAGVAAVLAFSGACLAAALGNNARPASFKDWFIERPHEVLKGDCAATPTRIPTPSHPSSKTATEHAAS